MIGAVHCDREVRFYPTGVGTLCIKGECLERKLIVVVRANPNAMCRRGHCRIAGVPFDKVAIGEEGEQRIKRGSWIARRCGDRDLPCAHNAPLGAVVSAGRSIQRRAQHRQQAEREQGGEDGFVSHTVASLCDLTVTDIFGKGASTADRTC